jgi:surface antigen
VYQSQQSSFYVSGTTTSSAGLCLDVTRAGTSDGTLVRTFTCNGTGAQQWRVGQIREGSWPGASGPVYANATFGYPYPNAPACTYGGACVFDKWDFYQGQCTSWVAYRLNELNDVAFNDSYDGQHWGDARTWASAARAAGIPVNGTPAPGSVAWYSSGHVAYVEQVISPTEVSISEMNYDYDNGFRVRTVTTSSGWPSGFIHIKDTSGGLAEWRRESR